MEETYGQNSKKKTSLKIFFIDSLQKFFYVNFKYLNEDKILTSTVYHSNDAP